MSFRITLAILTVAAASSAPAAVTVKAFYALGENDPGAVAGNLGDDPTVDAGPNHLDLTRRGAPHYSTDVPFNVPTAAGDHLSMFFDNNPLAVGPGPAANDGYSRPAQVALPSINWGIEAWVKPALADVSTAAPSGYSLIAYNGRYFSSAAYGAAGGLGLFQKGANFIVRNGFSEKVLAPVVPGKWTHLVFIRQSAVNRFFVNGTEEFDDTADAQAAPSFVSGGGVGDPLPPIFANGYLAIGSFPSGLVTPLAGITDPAVRYSATTDGFYGNIDEIRFFTFSLTGPTPLDPSADLLYVAPEPAVALAACATLAAPLAGRRRGHR